MKAEAWRKRLFASNKRHKSKPKYIRLTFKKITHFLARFQFPHMYKGRIQKPVVTYDPRKFSVTSRARLPNYLKLILKYNFIPL
jgi:hypothetical protein